MNDAMPNPPNEPADNRPPAPPPPPHPAQAPYAYAYPVYVNAGPPKPANGMGKAALALGIPCAATSWIAGLGVLAWAGGIVAIVLGSIGMAKAKRGEATNYGSALAGVILGALAVVVGIVIVTWLATTYS